VAGHGVALLARPPTHRQDGRTGQARFLILAGGVVGLAWLSLLWWGHSPYARLLDHEELERTNLVGDPIALVFVSGWTLMIVAMMLPTSLPLLTVFRTITRQRADRRQLLGLVVVGYLGVWVAFGVAVHGGDALLHRGVSSLAWLEHNPWTVTAATLALAGAYQFSAIKYRCLKQCRSPVMFVSQHWHGRNARRDALAVGAHHGIFCLGCCWTLMLLMFAVGIGNLGWMLLLGVIMGVEKNAPWASRISAPLGVLLLAASAATIAASV
jgi:predicted metal-binding membrane protein